METDEKSGTQFEERWGNYLPPLQFSNGLVVEHIGQLIVWRGSAIDKKTGEWLKGFKTIPWALDKYENILGLTPTESWLLRRLLGYYFSAKNETYPKLANIARASTVTRGYLSKVLKHLRDKGYVETKTDTPGRQPGQPLKYKFNGLFRALAICILADPRAGCVNPRGYLPVEEYRADFQRLAPGLDLEELKRCQEI